MSNIAATHRMAMASAERRAREMTSKLAVNSRRRRADNDFPAEIVPVVRRLKAAKSRRIFDAAARKVYYVSRVVALVELADDLKIRYTVTFRRKRRGGHTFGRMLKAASHKGRKQHRGTF